MRNVAVVIIFVFVGSCSHYREKDFASKKAILNELRSECLNSIDTLRILDHSNEGIIIINRTNPKFDSLLECNIAKRIKILMDSLPSQEIIFTPDSVMLILNFVDAGQINSVKNYWCFNSRDTFKDDFISEFRIEKIIPLPDRHWYYVQKVNSIAD